MSQTNAFLPVGTISRYWLVSRISPWSRVDHFLDILATSFITQVTGLYLQENHLHYTPLGTSFLDSKLSKIENEPDPADHVNIFVIVIAYGYLTNPSTGSDDVV